jgi:hypothetical protein
MQKAQDCWDHTMEVLSPQMMHKRVDPYDSRAAPRGASSARAPAPRRAGPGAWTSTRNSPRFGCLQLRKDGIEMSYIHGDYDLKDVVVDANAVTRETQHNRHKKLIGRRPEHTPLLSGFHLETIQARLNPSSAPKWCSTVPRRSSLARRRGDPRRLSGLDALPALATPERAELVHGQNRRMHGDAAPITARTGSRKGSTSAQRHVRPRAMPGRSWG